MNDRHIQIATLIVLAFTGIVSAYQAYEINRHDRLQIRPLLDFSSNMSEVKNDLVVTNSGMGTAILKSIQLYVDRIPVKDWSEAADHCGMPTNDPVDGPEISKDEPLRVGASISIISRSKKYKSGSEKFADCLDQRMSIRVHYCAIDSRDCQTSCWPEGRC